MSLVQITKKEGRVERVPYDKEPFVELFLDSNQTIVNFDLSPDWFISPERMTRDFHWTAWVATRL